MTAIDFGTAATYGQVTVATPDGRLLSWRSGGWDWRNVGFRRNAEGVEGDLWWLGYVMMPTSSATPMLHSLAEVYWGDYGGSAYVSEIDLREGWDWCALKFIGVGAPECVLPTDAPKW